MSKRMTAAAALLAAPAVVALSFSALWRRRPAAASEWTGPFTGAEYRAFVKVIALYFGVRKIPIVVNGGELTIEGPEGPRRELLGELAERCHRHDRSQWPDLVGEHFAAVADAAETSTAFTAAVEKYFQERGLEAKVKDEAVVVRDGAGEMTRYEVVGLRARCARVPDSDWPELIERAFDNTLRSPQGLEGVEGRSYAESRKLLAVMLLGEEELSAEEWAASVYGENLPGLRSLVVWRMPEDTSPLTREQLERWGKPAEEVLAAARANLQRLKPEAERVKLVRGMEALCLQGYDEFVASQALRMAEEPEWSGPYGALVALPRRGALFVCPLHATPGGAVAVAGAVVSLIVRCDSMRPEGPAPLKPRLYWYHEGRFTRLPYTLETKHGKPVVGFRPPRKFAAALVALREASAA